MGRKKRWAEDMEARFAEGTFAAIAAVSVPGEERTDFVREAVEREILRRWELVRPTLQKHADGTFTVAPYRETHRLTVLTAAASKSKPDDTNVTVTRNTLHAIDGMIIRSIPKMTLESDPAVGTLPTRTRPPGWKHPLSGTEDIELSAEERLSRIYAAREEEQGS